VLGFAIFQKLLFFLNNLSPLVVVAQVSVSLLVRSDEG